MISAIDHTVSIDETKTYRKELKMKPTVAAAIKRAAASVGMDMSTFMASSAFQAAHEIERAQHQTLLPDAAFDAFAAAVDRPGRRNPALGRLFQKRVEMIQGD